MKQRLRACSIRVALQRWKAQVSPMSIELFCPAKINWLLAITGKRKDCYHEMVSLVAPLAYGDRLRLNRGTDKMGISLKILGAELTDGPNNLAWRATELFLKRFGLEGSIDIEIEKFIPIGAGLGGGSSDAVGALKGLAALFKVDDEIALLELAAELGSDCPLFLKGEPVLMRGRGEKLEPLDEDERRILDGTPIALFKPAFGISTLWAYKALAADISQYANPSTVERSLDGWRDGKLPLSDLMQNSFESVVGQKYPSIPLVMDRIRRETGCQCSLSGSGSACFAIGQADSFGQIREITRECWGESAFFQETTISDIGLTETPGISS